MAKSIPSVRDFTAWQGADWESGELVCRDGEGDPVDLTGATVRCWIAAGAGWPKALEPEVEILDDEEGTVRLSLTAEKLAGTALREGVYDVEAELADGSTLKVFAGRFRVIPEVTRAK